MLCLQCRPKFSEIVPELERLLRTFKAPRPRYADIMAAAARSQPRRRSMHHARTFLGAVTRTQASGSSSFMAHHSPRSAAQGQPSAPGATTGFIHEEGDGAPGIQEASRVSTQGGGVQKHSNKKRGPRAICACLRG